MILEKLTQKKFIALQHNHYETIAWQNQQLVCGIDEAGRGSLAGSVVTAAAVLPPHASHPLLKDSKVLSAEQRNEAFAWIKKHCQFAFALGSVQEIEQINILNATKTAMLNALRAIITQLGTSQNRLAYIIVDAVPLNIGKIIPPEIAPQLLHPCKAESLSASVAAASIVAKVVRDELMTKLHDLFPAYCFADHKGYGTREHIQKIANLGPCIEHRNLFVTTALKNLELKNAKTCT